MAKKRKKIPTYIDYDTRTIYIQDKKTGLMKGRKRVRGFGDRTAIRRIKAKRIDGYRKGEILGRTD